MKKVVIIISLFLFTEIIHAQEPKHQIGVRLGSTEQILSSGISYRYHFNKTNSIVNRGLALEAIVNLKDDIAIGGLVEKMNGFEDIKGLTWYYGAGAYVGFGKSYTIGGTGIIGIDYQFTGEAPINISLDWKPELNLISTVKFFGSTVGLSIRYTFMR